ncbi:MAG: hypothetical protein WCA84_03300 [Ignavibacteriaceae bacterium]
MKQLRNGASGSGWDGAPKLNAPGFPNDGNWNLRWEGLKTFP